MNARLAVLFILLVAALPGCTLGTFASSDSAKRDEGTRWSITASCDDGVTRKSAVYELSKGSTRSTSEFGCMEVSAASDCKFCDPEIDGPCGRKTNGSIATLKKISGTLDAKKALFTTLHGSMGGQVTLYLDGPDGTYRCSPGIMLHDLEPHCLKVGTWKADRGYWDLPGPVGCKIAQTNVQDAPIAP